MLVLNLTDLSSEPLYAQILRQVRAQIVAGLLPASSPLPSIRDLARTQRVSVITVQKAYDELTRAGLLIARRGKGYFVAPLTAGTREGLALATFRDAVRTPVKAALAEGVPASAIRALVDELVSEDTPKASQGAVDDLCPPH